MDPKNYIQSQSNEKPKGDFNTYVSISFKDLSEQAFASRALDLLMHDLVNGVDSLYFCDEEIPIDYLEYLETAVNIQISKGNIVVVNAEGESLTQKIMNDDDAKTKLAKRGGLISVFTPTQNEMNLIEELKQMNTNTLPEISKQTHILVNKGVQHVALSEPILIDGEEILLRHNSELLDLHKLSNLELGSANDLLNYLNANYGNSKLLFKHPFSTAGEGLWTRDHIETVFNLIQQKNLIVVEQFFENSTEHSLHFRIDPKTFEYSYIGTYDQTIKDNGNGGAAHLGAVYPSREVEKAKFLEKIAPYVAKNLISIGVTGDMCCDVFVREVDGKMEVHFMEINPRTGANLYALRFAQAVMKSKFNSNDNPNFELITGQKFGAKSVTELFEKYPEIKDLCESGNVLLSNYGRFKYDSWDLIFLDEESLDKVEEIKEQVLNLIVKPIEA